jgi:hypothetical protein
VTVRFHLDERAWKSTWSDCQQDAGAIDETRI